MSASVSQVDETTDEQTADCESTLQTWSDDELFENVAEIINENFVLEVEASRRLRG